MSDDPFLDLQDGFYNAISQGLGFAPGSPFQLFQPSPPIVPGATADQTLWAYFNNIPPYSLTQNYISSGGNQFFSDYKGLLSVLSGAPNTFVQDVGEDVNAEWLVYLSSRKRPPLPQQLPQLFLNWAMIYAPSVANIGASDLSQILLDPITSAQNEMLMAYTGRLPDWSQGYADLVAQLAAAPSRAFDLESSSMNSNVSTSWTGGANVGFLGLWGNSSSSKSSSSSTFASSDVTVTASFEHVTTFTAAPGAWYSSAAMGDAYANRSGAPWKPDTPINWDTTFDPETGNMARFAANLIVVSGMTIDVTSNASFSSEQQTEIRNGSNAGMWPFYASRSSSGSSTDVEFDTGGRMTVTIASQPDVPVAIGCNVLSVDQYVGHAVPTQRREDAGARELAGAAR